MSSASDSERLRRMALDHLWMHNADWVQMNRDGEPLIIVEGNGVRVTDADGNSWFDVNGGYASVSAGYGRQDLARAAYEQMQRITFFPMRTANPPTIHLAAKLAEIMPGSLSRVFPVSGGSEANEAALKIARAYHRRRGDHGRYEVAWRFTGPRGRGDAATPLLTSPASCIYLRPSRSAPRRHNPSPRAPRPIRARPSSQSYHRA